MAQTNRKTAWLMVTILTSIPLLMVLGNSVLIPSMPTMQQKMHVSKLQISLIITLFSVPAGIIIPFAGILSDRLTRKWIVVPALLLFGVGGVLAGFASMWLKSPYTLVLIGRVIQGIGAAGTAPIAMAWIGDLFEGSERSKVLGVNEAGNALGKVLSPVIGAAIALFAWFAVFFVFPVLCLPVAAAVWWWLPDQKEHKKQSVIEYLRSIGQVAKREGRWLSVAYLCGAAALFTLFGVLFYLSDLLETKYKIDGLQKGLILAIPLLFLSASSLLTGAMIKKRVTLMKWLLVIGLSSLSIAIFLATWLAANAWLLVGLMSMGGAATGAILPCLNMLITSAVETEKRGLVTSLYGSVRFLGVAAGPPAFTWLVSLSTQVMFLSVAALAACCSLAALLFIRPGGASKDGTVNSSSTSEQSIRVWAKRGRQRARF